MWHLLKAEFDYFKIYFVIMFNFLLIICILPLWRSDFPESIQLILNDLTSNFILLIGMFLMFQMWLSLRNKENRTYLQILLPVSFQKIAIARILMFYLPGFLLIFLVTLFILLTKTVSLKILLRLVVFSGIIISLFSVYFIFRDLFVHFFRRIGLSKERLLNAALLLAVLFNLLGLFVFIKAKSGKMSFNFIDILRGFVAQYNPFTGEFGLIKFVVFFTVMSIISIFTFNRSKTYLE